MMKSQSTRPEKPGFMKKTGWAVMLFLAVLDTQSAGRPMDDQPRAKKPASFEPRQSAGQAGQWEGNHTERILESGDSK
ncbi:MAG: hypothetical protein AB1649_19035 [Chloroflexota bacterium]